LLATLVEQGLWDEARERKLTELPQAIDEMKVALFNAVFKSNERQVLRKGLADAKSELNRLYSDRHGLDHLSATGAASQVKSRYLLGCSMFWPTGLPVFTDESFWEEESGLLEETAHTFSAQRLDEVGLRELARTEPWRSLWSCKKSEDSVFGLAIADYTDEQRSLINWTTLYDSVYSHPETPSEDVVLDDDLLDGWLIIQKRKRGEVTDKDAAEKLITNERIRNCGEIYLMADTVEDAKRIEKLNDPVAKATKRERAAYLQKMGSADELDMPDTKREIQMAINRKAMEVARG